MPVETADTLMHCEGAYCLDGVNLAQVACQPFPLRLQGEVGLQVHPELWCCPEKATKS